MGIVIKILSMLLIIILVLLIIILVIFLYPFKYILDIRYDDKALKLSFKYFLISFLLKIEFNVPIEYRLKILSKTIFAGKKDIDAMKKIDKKSGEAIIETKIDSESKDIISNEVLVKETKGNTLKENDNVVKDLFVSAKKAENRQGIDSDSEKKSIESTIEKIKDFIPEDLTYIISLILDNISLILRRVRPREYKVDLSYGIRDPYIMGLTCAIVTPLKALSDSNMNIEPHFMEDSFTGHICAKSRVSAFLAIKPVLNILLDKKFRAVAFKKKADKKSK